MVKIKKNFNFEFCYQKAFQGCNKKNPWCDPLSQVNLITTDNTIICILKYLHVLYPTRLKFKNSNIYTHENQWIFSNRRERLTPLIKIAFDIPTLIENISIWCIFALYLHYAFFLFIKIFLIFLFDPFLHFKELYTSETTLA